MKFEDLVLIFISYGDHNHVLGKTRLTKGFFMLIEEVFPEFKDQAAYFPYQFGPYSNELAGAVNNLLITEKLQLSKSKGQTKISLTNKAKKQIKEIKLSDEENVKILKIKNFIQNPLKKILSHIYSNYYDYTTHSRIKDEVVYQTTIDLDTPDIDDGPGIVAGTNNKLFELNNDEISRLLKP